MLILCMVKEQYEKIVGNLFVVMRLVCRFNTIFHRIMYSEHKRLHGLKFPSAAVPNFLIAKIHYKEGDMTVKR